MSHPEDIKRLYAAILFHGIHQHSVSDEDMKVAISNMQQVYRPEPGILSSSVRRLADYNSIVYRCAYLHKYAPFHTVMVCDIVRHILQQYDNVFFAFQERFTRRKQFKICSLGGGPGCDIVGVLVAMFELFGPFRCSAKVIDIKSDWMDTLASVIEGLSSGMYGPVGECFTQRFLNWEYLTADLLEEVQDDVKAAIGSAEMVTMVKFVSAAACESTEWMLKRIFTMLRLGAVVLFIDNSSGGFRQLVSKAATDCNLTSVCGPIHFQNYTNEAFNFTHWDHNSCYSTTVSIHMMQKLHPTPSSINTASQTVTSESTSNNKLSSRNSNDKPIQNELPTPGSSPGPSSINITSQTIASEPPSNNKLSSRNSNDKPIQNELPTPGSNGSAIHNDTTTPCSNDDPIRN